MAIPPWTRSASGLRGASSSPRGRGVTPGLPRQQEHEQQQQQQQQQQQGARLTVDTVHDAGDEDDVSFAGGSRNGNDGGLSGSGGVSALSAVRYDAW